MLKFTSHLQLVGPYLDFTAYIGQFPYDRRFGFCFRYTLRIVVIVLCVYLAHLDFVKWWEEKEMKFQNFLLVGQYFAVFFAAFVCCIKPLTERSAYRDLLERFDKIESYFERPVYRAGKHFMVTAVKIVAVGICTVQNLLSDYTGYDNNNYFIAQMICIVMNGTTVSLMLFVLDSQFGMLLSSMRDTETVIGDWTIEYFVRVREEIVRACKRLNEAANLELVAILGNFDLAVTECAYYMKVDIGNEKSNPVTVPLFFVWLGIFFEIVTLCNSIAYRDRQFCKLMQGILRKGGMQILHSNPNVALSITKTPFKFTAHGAFDIDNTLIYSMVSSAVSFTVVLIQFGN